MRRIAPKDPLLDGLYQLCAEHQLKFLQENEDKLFNIGQVTSVIINWNPHQIQTRLEKMLAVNLKIF